MPAQNICPYATYQRALDLKDMSIVKAVNDPDAFNAAMVNMLSPKGKKDPQFVKRFLSGARKHLDNDYNIIAQFRL